MVRVKLLGCPSQVAPAFITLGVTVMLAKMGVLEALIGVKAGIFPVPDAGKPMAILSFVHVKLAPETEALKAGTDDSTALQRIMSAGWFNVGIGFTTML